MNQFTVNFETIDAFVLYEFVTNIPLLLVSIGMIFFVSYGSGLKQRLARYSFIVILVSLILAFFSFAKEFVRISADYGINLGPIEFRAFLVNFFGLSCYIIRPLALFFFIQLAEGKDEKRLPPIFFIIPLIINAIVFTLGFIPGARDIVLYWMIEGDTIHYTRNSASPLGYTAHFVSALFLVYLVFVSIKKIKSHHIEDAVIIIVLTIFAVLSVILESKYEIDFLVNATIAISCVFYYLFLHNQSSKKDALTGLYSRATYYEDVNRFGKNIVAVVELDMNGLKYLNDNHGHEAGDNALIGLANIIAKNIDNKNMCAYRLGGDEFLILVFRTSAERVEEMCLNIRHDLIETRNSCSIGWMHRDHLEEEPTFSNLMKEAEKQMYADKEVFYRNSSMERRKSTR